MNTKTFEGMAGDGIIDIRDLIARHEELEEALQEDASRVMSDLEERVAISKVLAKLKGNGGDEQWLGDWYPVTPLIKDSYFTEYAAQLIKDCDGLPSDIPDYIVIDWEQTAKNIQVDYSSIEIAGDTYWYR